MATASQQTRRIVLTGGPGSGKTVISKALAASEPSHFVAVPEAATQVYEAMQTRWDRIDEAMRKRVQLRIYELQLQQEESHARQAAGKMLVLDRGTVDGAAYWPQGPQEYWRALGTDPREQMARYDLVIWLQSCAAIGLYDGAASNPRRHESAEAAMAIGQRVREQWMGHRQFHEVAACATLPQKIRAVRAVIAAVLQCP